MNEIDTLMALDPLDLTKQNIDDIIKYQRKMRGQFEAGIKPVKEKSGLKASDLLDKLGIVKPPEPMKRRV